MTAYFTPEKLADSFTAAPFLTSIRGTHTSLAIARRIPHGDVVLLGESPGFERFRGVQEKFPKISPKEPSPWSQASSLQRWRRRTRESGPTQ